jgi:predicted RNase H-like HicB family nuclease
MGGRLDRVGWGWLTEVHGQKANRSDVASGSRAGSDYVRGVQAQPPGAVFPRPAGSARDAVPWYSRDVNHRGLDAYKIVLYRQDDGSWVAEVPAISGCYALMATREDALAELSHVFDMIAEEYHERGTPLPEDTTEIVNA